jgi:hypothetical protein
MAAVTLRRPKREAQQASRAPRVLPLHVRFRDVEDRVQHVAARGANDAWLETSGGSVPFCLKKYT